MALAPFLGGIGNAPPCITSAHTHTLFVSLLGQHRQEPVARSDSQSIAIDFVWMDNRMILMDNIRLFT